MALDRCAAAVKSSSDVGRDRNETRLAKFGIPDAQHAAHEVDVGNREPEHFTGAQSGEVQEDQGRCLIRCRG